MSEVHQFEPNPAGNPYPPPRPLPALLRFSIAAIWTAAVFWFSGFVYAFFPERNLVPGILFRLIACVLTAAGYVFFLRVLDYSTAPIPSALGLPLDSKSACQWASGFALGAFLIAADVAFIASFGRYQWHLHLSRPMFLRFLGVALLLFFAALMEEVSFRGYPFQKLTEALGAFWAIVALSALFGAVHLWNPSAKGILSWAFFNTLAVGLLFALARIRTGSLWFSFGLHLGWNLFQGAVFGLPVSGIRDFSTVISSTTAGSPALTGGAYGPEASASCTIVLVIALPLLWWLTSSRNIQHSPALFPASSGI